MSAICSGLSRRMSTTTIVLVHIRALTSDVRFRWNVRHGMVRLSAVIPWVASCTIIPDVLHSSPMPRMDVPHRTRSMPASHPHLPAMCSARASRMRMAASVTGFSATLGTLGRVAVRPEAGQTRVDAEFAEGDADPGRNERRAALFRQVTANLLQPLEEQRQATGKAHRWRGQTQCPACECSPGAVSGRGRLIVAGSVAAGPCQHCWTGKHSSECRASR